MNFFDKIKRKWDRIRDHVQDIIDKIREQDDEPGGEFADPTQPFTGYGVTDNWKNQATETYLRMIAKYGVDCVAYEFFRYDQLHDIDSRIEKFKKHIELADKHKLLLYVQLWNCNTDSARHQTVIYKAARFLRDEIINNKRENIFITPCGEGGNGNNSLDRKLQEWFKSRVPKKYLVNNWPSKPGSSKDGMGYVCNHPSSTSAALKLPSWIMSDHSSFMRELNAGPREGSPKYSRVLNSAKKILGSGRTFIVYHGWWEPPSEEACRALRDAKEAVRV